MDQKNNQIMGDSSSLTLVGSKRSRQTFDVFISFRGEDTRRSFTSHLISSLNKKGVDVFFDERLERGDAISEALVEAIEGSKVSLVIFSENYASSRWCLDELIQILHCKKMRDQFVIPIFYNVDPSHVRWQKQSFATAFSMHEVKYMKKVNQWRCALHEAANISGHNSSKLNSDPELIDAIVGDTIRKLRRISCRPNQTNGLVGIEPRMEKVLRYLDIGQHDVLVLGIWGMGGIGKTTLAETVFEHILGDFEGSYFFRNVRQTEEKGDLFEGRNACLCAILGEDLHKSTSTLPRFVADRLRRKRLLVVLDDVSHQRQLEMLFKGLEEFGAGSRVIITTRDRHVLNIFPRDKIQVYGVEELNEDEASRLFRHCADVSGHGTEDYDELVEKVVRYASGIPLALKVFARSLRGKGKHKWESATNKLGKVPNLEIRDILKVSYDGLEDEEIKNMFLDIACFFKGHDGDQVARLLDGCYNAVAYGLSVLEDKALITTSENKIEMTDPLQELGWDIVTQECKSDPGRRTRLWRPEDVHRILKRNNGTETIRGIFMDLSKVKEVIISPNVFEKMYNLSLLKFYGRSRGNIKVNLSRGLEFLPDELRYLCWREFPLKCLPSDFCPENLVELDMSESSLNQLWSGTQNLDSLKILKLAGSKKLEQLPDLSMATNLERIDLSYCSKIDEFPEIQKSIKEINLLGTAIQEVPSSIQHLSRLLKLNLGYCKRLEKLPDSLSTVDTLEVLSLSGCGSLMSLPNHIWKMKSLHKLDLSRCSKLERVPDVVERNECMEIVDLSKTAIRELPCKIERLVRLERLWIDECRNLVVLPETLCNLENLIELSANKSDIRELPSSITRLVKLKRLSVAGCENLSALPEALWNHGFLIRVSARGTSTEKLLRLESLGLKDFRDRNISMLPETLWDENYCVKILVV